MVIKQVSVRPEAIRVSEAMLGAVGINPTKDGVMLVVKLHVPLSQGQSILEHVGDLAGAPLEVTIQPAQLAMPLEGADPDEGEITPFPHQEDGQRGTDVPAKDPA